MDKTQTVLALALLLGGAQAGAAAKDVDLRTLQLLKEEGVSFEEFEQNLKLTETKSGGNYSNFSISDGNYSNFSISDANYSNFSISDGNYSNFSISDANYSNFSISGGRIPARKHVGAIPAPVVAKDDKN